VDGVGRTHARHPVVMLINGHEISIIHTSTSYVILGVGGNTSRTERRRGSLMIKPQFLVTPGYGEKQLRQFSAAEHRLQRGLSLCLTRTVEANAHTPARSSCDADVSLLARLGAGCGEGHGSSDRATVTAEKQSLLVQVIDDAGDGVRVVGEQVPKNDTARLGGPWRVSDDVADA
jgi:hypothetical protein